MASYFLYNTLMDVLDGRLSTSELIDLKSFS